MFVRQLAQPGGQWGGAPNDQAAHDWLLAAMTHMGLPFTTVPMTTRMQGNLGECCGMLIGEANDFNGFMCVAANAFQPLQDISRSEMDLVWTWLDPNPMGDYAVLQEVKTTGADTLGYADSLEGDFKKLFGTDPALTLQTRLNLVANHLEYGQGRMDHADRVRTLAGLSPQQTTDVVLLPTVVYDSAKIADPGPKMSAVRQKIVAKGWAPDAVESWAVGLGHLIDRLTRLKSGQH
jgi:hypothetical protein